MVAIFRVGSAVACAVVLTACQSVTSPVGGTPGRRDTSNAHDVSGGGRPRPV